VEALFDLDCRAQDWQAALDALDIARRQHLIDQPSAIRRRAVLLTALAQQNEDGAADKALAYAQEAHRLAPDLVPAAAIAGRILAGRGQTPRAARVLLKTWRIAPHPDLAAAYAYARPGDSPRDRLARARHLARLSPNHPEAQIALAIGAIEAREWGEARAALEPLIADRLTPRVCTLMARIEGEEMSDAGRVREWLARAATAQRDAAWTADGAVMDHWAPVSPVTGALDAVQWRQPAGESGAAAASLAAKVDALIGLAREQRGGPAAPRKPVAEEEPTTIEVTAPPPQPAKALPPAPSPPQQEPITLTPVAPPPAPAEQPAPAPQPAAARARPAPKPAPAARPPVHKPVEPKVFVSPRPPDDPGPDPLEGDGLSVYPVSGAKA
jgi:HemY protein